MLNRRQALGGSVAGGALLAAGSVLARESADGALKVLQGVTTIEEVLLITADEL